VAEFVGSIELGSMQTRTSYLNFDVCLTLNMEAGGFFRMLVPIYKTKWGHIYEDGNLYIHHRDSLTVHKKLIFSVKMEF